MLPCVVVHLGEAEMKVHLCKAVQTAQSGETNEHNFLKYMYLLIIGFEIHMYGLWFMLP